MLAPSVAMAEQHIPSYSSCAVPRQLVIMLQPCFRQHPSSDIFKYSVPLEEK